MRLTEVDCHGEADSESIVLFYKLARVLLAATSALLGSGGVQCLIIVRFP